MSNENAKPENVKLIETCDFVAKTNEWNTRYYINLVDCDNSYRGDKSAKVWYQNNTVYYQMGKGIETSGFCSNLDDLKEFCESNGIEWARK